MGLEKAFIVNTVTGDKIEVLFNPAEYTFEKSNRFAEVGIPGTGSPFLQFVRGEIKKLSTELFFDTYEKRTDVREYTNKIVVYWTLNLLLMLPLSAFLAGARCNSLVSLKMLVRDSPCF